MPKFSSWGICLLALLLPVQNIIAQLSLNILHLPVWINFWKESVALLILLDLLIYTIRHRNLLKKIHKHSLLPLICIVSITIIALYNSFIINHIDIDIFIRGFRFDLFWLWIFSSIATFAVLFPSVSPTLLNKLTKSVYIGFIASALITITTLVFGQNNVLNILGYGGTEISRYITVAPTCHVIDYGNDSCRLAGSFSTPNHFAGYLLLVLPIFLINSLSLNQKLAIISRIFTALSAIFILLTFARFALLGMGMSAIVYILCVVGKKNLKNKLWSQIGISLTLIAFFSVGIIFINIDPKISSQYLPSFIAKPSSTIEHYRRSSASLDILSQAPDKIVTGYGVGYVGPAGKLEYLEPERNLFRMRWEATAYKWGLVGEDLVIPENWYLQLILSGGILYTLLYILLVSYPLKQKNILYTLSFLCILLGNLFLHIWENQTIAYYWSIVYLHSQLSKNSNADS
jgi:hypothetical protein